MSGFLAFITHHHQHWMKRICLVAKIRYVFLISFEFLQHFLIKGPLCPCSSAITLHKSGFAQENASKINGQSNALSQQS